MDCSKFKRCQWLKKLQVTHMKYEWKPPQFTFCIWRLPRKLYTSSLSCRLYSIFFNKWEAGDELVECIERHFSIVSVHNAAQAAVTQKQDKYYNYYSCLSQLTRFQIVCLIHHAWCFDVTNLYPSWGVKVRFSAAPLQGSCCVGDSILNCILKWVRLC